MNFGHRGVRLRLGTVLTVLLATLTPALAFVNGDAFITYPSTVTVGETNVPVSITVVNSSLPPNSAENVLLLDFIHFPSCAATTIFCNPPDLDPGVFAVVGPAMGQVGTACAGVDFLVTIDDMMTGEVQFTPAGQVVLAPADVGGPAATCTITFQLDVLKLPTKDADLQVAGIQTNPQFVAHLKGASSGIHGIGGAATQVTVGLTTVHTGRASFLQAAGQVTQINFDQDACGNTITGPSGGLLAGSIYSPVGVTFAAGVIFPDVSFATSPPNIISNTQINTPTPALVDATFTSPVHAIGINNVGAGAVLRAFGENNALIVSANTNTDPATSDFIGVTSPAPIHRFEYDFVSGLGFGGDDLVFTQIQTPDCTAPVLSVPGTLTVDATGPAGAVVTYSASATDNVDPTPTVSCSPPSGSTFPIGATTVLCTATDASGNSATASFQVIVEDATNQTVDLMRMISGLEQGVASSLTAKLEAALGAINAANLSGACGVLGAFINEVEAQSGKKASVAQTAELIGAANQIEAVLGCP